MYAGTTLTPMSGRILGAHQKLDRVARRHLSVLLGKDDHKFPPIREILKFEGRNGPDGIKRKSPAQNEPWHYINPFDLKDTELARTIEDHHQSLIEALRDKNDTRAAFEAAWLAHAIVDGLTPAHHFPYEEELSKIRDGQGLETRDTVMQKIIMPGSSPGRQVRNNWKMWGPKGLMSTHGFFEIGIATMIAPLSFRHAVPKRRDIETVQQHGIIEFFQQRAREIAGHDFYRKYYQTGWTPRLAQEVRRELAPAILQVISLAWYSAARTAFQEQA